MGLPKGSAPVWVSVAGRQRPGLKKGAPAAQVSGPSRSWACGQTDRRKDTAAGPCPLSRSGLKARTAPRADGQARPKQPGALSTPRPVYLFPVGLSSPRPGMTAMSARPPCAGRSRLRRLPARQPGHARSLCPAALSLSGRRDPARPGPCPASAARPLSPAASSSSLPLRAGGPGVPPQTSFLPLSPPGVLKSRPAASQSLWVGSLRTLLPQVRSQS